MRSEIVKEKLAIVIKPLATPLSTSIEFSVLPVITIIKITIGKYKSGILTSPKIGNAKLES